MKYSSSVFYYEPSGCGWAVRRGKFPTREFYMVEEHAKLQVVLENNFLEKFYSSGKTSSAANRVNLFFGIMHIRHERGLSV